MKMIAVLALDLALEARNLSAQLGGRQVLAAVSLQLPAGRWTSIIGPNGAGKSTLLRALAGLQPHSGQVLMGDQPLTAWPAKARARHLVWLGQGEAAAPDLTVWDIVMLGRLPHQPWLAAPSAADVQAVTEALTAVQALPWRQRRLGQLSGGERQRVLLARALATDAQVLLMDEPLANLDPPHQADWVALVRALVARGRTVVSVLHELNVALLADDVVVMADGRIAHHGASADPATHAVLEAVFDNRVRVHSVDGQRIALPVF